MSSTAALKPLPTRQPARVLVCLGLLATLGLLGLPLLGVAPNRILTPRGVYLGTLLMQGQWMALGQLMPLLLLAAALWRVRHARGHVTKQAQVASAPGLDGLGTLLCLASVWLGFAGLAWLAGDFAWLTRQSLPASRVSLGAGLWLALLAFWLLAMETLRQAPSAALQSSGARVLLSLLLAATLTVPLLAGHFDALSLMLEYRANRDALSGALTEHLRMVGTALLLALTLGLWLGIRAYRAPRLGRVLLGVLGILQTIPAIALFALLLAPLAALSRAWPWLSEIGVRGIGLAPAVIALLLYALLPMVHATQAGLQQVPAALLQAAHGMGMSARQVLWQVHLRLALPVIVAGVRVTAVQSIGLAVLGALVGAGGFGALVFRGLAGSALDLVLLGVIPVVLLAALADALFRLLAQALSPGQTGALTQA